MIHILAFALFFSHVLGLAALRAWIHPDTAHRLLPTMPETGSPATKEVTTQSDMDDNSSDQLSLRGIQRELDDLKESVEYAHQNNIRTQTQVGNFVSKNQLVDDRLNALEREVTSLKRYAEDLENYCISLDQILRKHHLLLNGVQEIQGESVNLTAFRILQTCFQDISVADIDYCYRIGAPLTGNQFNKKPRPILVKLLREEHQRYIYRNRNVLRQTESYASVFINEDLPQIIMKRRADVRSVYLNAKEKGHDVKMIGTKVIVDNVPYTHKHLEILPLGLKLSDSKIVKVKGGLAFATANAYLSNFFKCNLRYNGMVFDSSERAYQYERCNRLGAPEIAQQVLDARGASECKHASGYIKSNDKWDAQKRDIMREIVLEKFSQNEDLLDSLLSTGTKTLIEATTDKYWGAAAVIGSKLLKNGSWKGRNELGLILSEVREELKRERNWVEMRPSSSDDQGADLPPPPPSPALRNQDLDSDLIAPSQSTQNISVRGGNKTKRKRNKGNRNRNSQQNESTSDELQLSVGGQTSSGNHAVTLPASGLPHEHAQQETSSLMGHTSDALPHSWTASVQPGPQLFPNFGIPPPGFPTPLPPWPYSLPSMAPSLHQLQSTGTSTPYPWTGFQPPHIPQPINMEGLPCLGMNSRGVAPYLTQSTNTRPSHLDHSYSGAAKGNPNKNVHYGFQKQARTSLSSGVNKSKKNESKEVRSKSLSSFNASIDPRDLTVRIGSQAF